MRFDPCQCPRCGEAPYRILATVETVTRLNRSADGTFEFDDSAVSWETQALLITDGMATIFCRNHHGFQVELVPDEDDTSGDTDESVLPASVTDEPESDDSEPDDNLLIALTLLVVNPGIRAYLEQHEPALLRQARNAMYEATGLLPIDGESDISAVGIDTARNTDSDMLKALRSLETALEFYPHWKPSMRPFLLGIVREAIAKAEANGGAS